MKKMQNIMKTKTTIEFSKIRKFFFLLQRCFRVLKMIYQKMEGGKNVEMTILYST